MKFILSVFNYKRLGLPLLLFMTVFSPTFSQDMGVAHPPIGAHAESEDGAVKIVLTDTENDGSIIRLMETGPLPKMIATSHDGKPMVLSHWRNYPVGLIDIPSDDPKEQQYKAVLIVDQQRQCDGFPRRQCGERLRRDVCDVAYKEDLAQPVDTVRTQPVDTVQTQQKDSTLTGFLGTMNDIYKNSRKSIEDFGMKEYAGIGGVILLAGGLAAIGIRRKNNG